MEQEIFTPPVSPTSPQTRRFKFGLWQKLAVAAALVVAVGLGLFIGSLISPHATHPALSEKPAPSSEPEAPVIPQPDENGFLDLQPVVDAWLASLDSNINVGLMLYDLDRDQIAAAYQPDQLMNIASIYKLFYVYAGYRQLENGSIDATKTYLTTRDYRAGSYTFGECLDLMVRESYNGCADPIRASATQTSRALAIMDELNLKNTKNAGLISTAADLTKLMQLFWEHPDLSAETWAKISDSMLNQPPTKVSADITYDWRQGLPTGFSESVKVYDKVGWEWSGSQWNIYADAAFLEFPAQNRHYSLVVITSGIKNRTPYELQSLAHALEDAISP